MCERCLIPKNIGRFPMKGRAKGPGIWSVGVEIQCDTNKNTAMNTSAEVMSMKLKIKAIFHTRRQFLKITVIFSWLKLSSATSL